MSMVRNRRATAGIARWTHIYKKIYYYFFSKRVFFFNLILSKMNYWEKPVRRSAKKKRSFDFLFEFNHYKNKRIKRRFAIFWSFRFSIPFPLKRILNFAFGDINFSCRGEETEKKMSLRGRSGTSIFSFISSLFLSFLVYQFFFFFFGWTQSCCFF